MIVTSNEHEDQAAVVSWARDNSRWCPELAYLMASQNGAALPANINNRGQRYSLEAVRLVEVDMVKGVSYLFLPAARGEYHGLWVEMKHGHNRVTPDQQKFITAMRRFGYKAEACWGADAAIELLKSYVSLKPDDLP